MLCLVVFAKPTFYFSGLVRCAAEDDSAGPRIIITTFASSSILHAIFIHHANDFELQNSCSVSWSLHLQIHLAVVEIFLGKFQCSSSRWLTKHSSSSSLVTSHKYEFHNSLMASQWWELAWQISTFPLSVFHTSRMLVEDVHGQKYYQLPKKRKH